MGAARTLGAGGNHGLQSRDADQGGLVTIAEGVPGERLARAAFDLARRFASGATMWCVAPEWPEHARHVAVEFVHPVIVGKRALPAVAIEGRDPVAALRTRWPGRATCCWPWAVAIRPRSVTCCGGRRHGAFRRFGSVSESLRPPGRGSCGS